MDGVDSVHYVALFQMVLLDTGTLSSHLMWSENGQSSCCADDKVFVSMGTDGKINKSSAVEIVR